MTQHDRMSIAEIMALADSVGARMDANDDDKGTGNDDTAGTDRADDKGSEGNPEGYDDLGDKGKQALDRMKAERDEETRKRKAVEQELADSKKNNSTSDRNGGKDDKVSDEGKTQDDAKPEGKSAEQVENDILGRMTAQALRSTVREIAAGKLADPNDALVLGDFSDIKPNDFGEFDRAVITERIGKLTEAKPYLAAKGTTGSSDGGYRGDTANKSQLTQADLKNMTPAEIVAASKEGRLENLQKGN